MRFGPLWLLVSFAPACASLGNLTGSSDAGRAEAGVGDTAVGKPDVETHKGDAGTDAADGAPWAVLFGGEAIQPSGEENVFDDTWAFSGKTWSKMNPVESPPGRTGAGGGTLGGDVVIFGGAAAMGMGNFDDTWSLDHGLWTELSSGSTSSPSARASLGVAAMGGGLVLFGGYDSVNDLNDTWLWHGSSWSQAHPTTSPPVRNAMVMASFGGSVVLFGGVSQSDLDDTWVWDGMDWTQKKPAHSPSARSYATAAVSAGPPALLVLFGGYSTPTSLALDDTWTWDGTDWSEVHPVSSPPARDSSMMIGVPGGVLLFGGQDGGNTTNFADTWIFDGRTWSQVTTSGPSPRDSAVLSTP